jgi:hypothetical protein
MSSNIFMQLKIDKVGLAKDISRVSIVFFKRGNNKKMFKDRLIITPNDSLPIADIHN